MAQSSYTAGLGSVNGDRRILKSFIQNSLKKTKTLCTIQLEGITIMMSLFDDEEIMRNYGKSERYEADRATVERMIKKGKMTLEEIADYVPTLSFDELKEIEAEILQLA